jgi:hypothetical protein
LRLGAPLLTAAQKTTLVIGIGACRGPLDARCGAKYIGLFMMQRKSNRKLASEPPFHQNLAHEYPSSSEEANLTEGRTTATKNNTERNLGLSVIVFIKPAASGDKC